MKQEQNQMKAFFKSQDYLQITPSHENAFKNPKDITYFDSQQENKRIRSPYKEHSLADCDLDSHKLELINEMLRALGYNKSVEALQAEISRNYECRNPQNSSGRKKTMRANNLTLDNKIQNIIKENVPFQEMLQSLTFVLNQQNEQKMAEEVPQKKQYRQPLNNPKLEKAIQHLFPRKQTITLPIYKQLEIDCGNKEIKFAQINQQGSICLLDNQNSLYIVSAQRRQNTQTNRTRLVRMKIDEKKQIIDMKWVNPHLVVLLTSNNKVLFFNADKPEHLKTIKSNKLLVKTHHICIMRGKKAAETKSLFILSVSQHRFVPIKFNFQGNNITDEKMPYFQDNFALKAITVIKVPHIVKFHRRIQFQNEQAEFNIVTDIEHFYGLAKNSKKIIKFDTIVEKSGVIWECSGKEFIWELKNSNCGYFLQVLIISHQSRYKSQDSRQNKICSFLKISGSGNILQKIDFALASFLKNIHMGFQQITQKQIFQSKGLKWHKLNPQWIRCYSYKNKIIYFSINSGKIIFNQQIEQKELKIYGVGTQNNILYKSNGKLVLLSASQKSRMSVELQSKRNLDMRETLIQRFSRLHGIPQNLLLLLRSIRNNDIELMEIGQ